MSTLLYRTNWKVFLLIMSLVGFISCGQPEETAQDSTSSYDQAVADFYMSLGASETDQTRFAFNKMNDVAQAFPEETAAWANLAVFAMRQGNFNLANERIGQALERSPNHPQVLHLAGLIASRQGNTTEAIDYFRQASEQSDNPRILYALAQELERENPTGNAEEIKETLRSLLEKNKNNQVVLLELVRIAIREENADQAEEYLNRLRDLSDNWNEQNREQLDLVFEMLEQQNFSDLSLELSFLRSGLESQPRFQADLSEVRLSPTQVGFLITEFINLDQPDVKAAPPDIDMQLTRQPLDVPPAEAVWVKGVTLSGDSPPFPITVADGSVVINEQTELEFPGETVSKLSGNAVQEIDFNYDFRNDLAAVGSNGFRLYQLNEDQTFSDVTSTLGLTENITDGSYTGVWSFDVELDGDLDLLLSSTNGSSFVLRNNGDGTFSQIVPFSENQSIKEFLWADLDGEGTPEATVLNEEGAVIIYANQRGGEFDEGTQLAENQSAIAVADMDANARFEIISVDESGNFSTFNFSYETGEWQSINYFESGLANLTSPNLFTADLDNNGSIDLVLSTDEQTHVWLGDEQRNPVKLEKDLPGKIYSVFDVEGDEKLDLLGIAEDGTPYYLKTETTKEYFARSIRAQASGTTGDQRINSFGIGGEMEVRSGLLYQKQLISSPIVHFGLGEYEEAQMLRIIWPNGSVQAEFAELGMGSTIFNEQILKGSCPWLFSHDGEEMQFVTDILWRSPLGLRINAQETAGVVQTLDRVKIPSEMIQADNGVYKLRITAELWESHFFDHVRLMAVDHPENTEIFVDERFVFPAPDLSTKLMSSLEPVENVMDENGNNLTEETSAIDKNYIQPFEKTKYQGLAQEHSIEISLSEQDADLLVLNGWLRPTDSSINLALSQGSIEAPKGLQVEYLNKSGEWKLLHENYGIPAGKSKTILLDLEGVFSNQSDRKIRLTTTSEIYWDGIFQAQKLDQSEIEETALEPLKMELQYRGFSKWSRADSTSPMLADYNEISSTTQRWRDLEGFHTRFGDVSELLAEVDDRYVIMNAGDEIELEFKAPESPKKGYQRSFVFVSDGWEKDGDYNTEASATVLPLPYHGQADYDYGNGGILWDDPVYQKHKEDWVNYHTRYITPRSFRSALLFDE
ncbi:MAG: FG-GAP-like repeat-containing protein [Balneolaceae bacterium]|nr:FG-GAP-like repeat-containing protein [Balneolaceae bacterium]